MAISNEKLLQRIVKKYDLIPYDENHPDVYKPKPTGLIEFEGGLIKLDCKGFWLCEQNLIYEPYFKGVMAHEFYYTSRQDLHKNIKKILKAYRESKLKAIEYNIKKKLQRINKDF